MPETGTFQEVLSAAIDDMLANGFDSVERVQRWTRELRDAARRSMVSPESVEDELRRGLASTYRKMVDRGRIFTLNPGVERFTLERVRPQLRAELDRRIQASADLIRLNRDEAIEKTLRRFQGWSTSIPRGGSNAESRRATKTEQRKALGQLRFEERRVLVDQGHKLVSSLSEILAKDGAAIAARWRSNWRQPGYDYREDHRERDNEVYLLRRSWAVDAGLVKPGRAGYTDDVTQPAQEPFCRCYFIWIYHLRELPADMLTKKGADALQAARGLEEVRSARFARGDAIDTGARADAATDEKYDFVVRPSAPSGFSYQIKVGEKYLPGQRWYPTEDAATQAARRAVDRLQARGRRGDAAKVSKQEAEYVGPFAPRPQGRRCDGCTMREPPLACTEVAGDIDPGGYCRFHEPELVPALAPR